MQVQPAIRRLEQFILHCSVILLVIAIGLLFATSPLVAQIESPAVAATVLDEFQREWDDTSWEPATGRLSKYLRPPADIGWKRRMRTLAATATDQKQSVPALIAALASDSPALRALAAQALGFTDDVTAREALANSAENDDDAAVRLYAADSLGMLGGRELAPLLRRLESSEKNSDVKRHIRYALERDEATLDRSVAEQLRHWDASKLNTAQVGQLAPDFELPRLTGESIRLSQYRGKQSVIVVFVYGDT